MCLTLISLIEQPPVDQQDRAAAQTYKDEKDALTDCLINIGICNQRLLQYDQAVEIFNTGKSISYVLGC
jgi:hypothetical protein